MIVFIYYLGFRQIEIRLLIIVDLKINNFSIEVVL